MKYLKTFLVVIVAIIVPISALGYDFKIGNLCYNKFYENSVEVTYKEWGIYNYAGMTDLVIPDSVTYEDKTYAVEAISLYAFQYCTSLKSVTMPETMKYIYSYCFKGCKNLETVIFGRNVQFIRNLAFLDCHKLKSITVCNAFPFFLEDEAFDQETYDSATLFVPTGRSVFFQEHLVWGKFANVQEKDIPGIEVSESPFDNLYSKRLIIGYSDGGGDSQWFTKDDEVTQAIKFPQERMSRIKGNKITHIRFMAWNGEGIDNVKVWIGSARDKRNIVNQDVPDIHEGWNEISLENPYTITGDSIIVGVDYHCSALSLMLVKGDSRAGDEEGARLEFYDGEWHTRQGSVGIQCLVQGDQIPEYDLHLVGFNEALYSKVVKAGEKFYGSLIIRNWGSKGIERYEMDVKMDGKDVNFSNSDTRILRNMAQQSISIWIVPDEGSEVGIHPITILPKTCDGKEYSSPEPPLHTKLKIYKHDIGRQKVLVQVYTGTWCGYCPDFDELVELKRNERGDLALLDIHIDDRYVTPASECYQTLMIRGGVPDVDLNRCTWFTPYNFRTTVINEYLDNAKSQPSFANIQISGDYDKETRTVHLTVNGERNEDFVPIEVWTNLTVLLVEDNVKGYQYGSDLGAEYLHQGIIRTNVSPVWGDLVRWDGDSYSMSYSATLNESWEAENMRVVAFLSKPFTGVNYSEIPVLNCEEMNIKDMFSGIESITTNKTLSDIYDLYGRRIKSNSTSLEELPHGIYIVGGKKVVK